MKDKMAEREKKEKEMALKDPESRLEQRVKNKYKNKNNVGKKDITMNFFPLKIENYSL